MTDEYVRKEDASDAMIKHLQLDYEYAWGVREAINALPSADVVQVVHAHWKDNKNGTVSCSRCSTWFQKEREPYLRFCGYCGAKMDAQGEE